MIGLLLETVLAGLGVDRATRDGMIGDLVEEHDDLVRGRGTIFANRWLCRQIAGSIGSVVVHVVRSRGSRLFASTILPAAAVFVATMLVAQVCLVLFGDAQSTDALRRFVAIVFVADMLLAFIGAYVAAVFSRAAPLIAAVAFGGLGLALSFSSGSASWPNWYLLAFRGLLVPVTFAGGLVRVARSAHCSPKSSH